MMRPRESGFTLVEVVVATALALVVIGVVFAVVGRTQQAATAGLPRAEGAMTAMGLEAELAATVADASAKLRYFDRAATMAAVRARIRSASGASVGEGAAAGGNGGSGGAGAGSLPHEVGVAPVFRMGDGLLWRCAEKELPLAGPVSVWRDGGLGVGEVGDSLTVLRTDPAGAPLRLGSPFYTAGGTIRLVARDADAMDAVGTLGAGSQLVVVGRDGGGAVRSVLVELSGAPTVISVPSAAREDGSPIFVHFEAACSVPAEPSRAGLYNSREVAGGTTIAADASVAQLDPAVPVVSYYARPDTAGVLRLVRLDGAVADDTAEELPGALAGPMRLELALSPEADGLTEADRLLAVTATFGLRSPAGEVHPFTAVLDLREGAVRLSEATLYWDVVGAGSGEGGAR